MADVVDYSTRSRMMAGIKGKNTKPEIEIRKKLFALGYRYRHDTKLPGKPDLILPRYNAIIFFNGCFWHAHDCALFKWPSTRKKFWKKKLTRNREKDLENNEALKELGWKILIIWECAFRGAGKNREKEIDVIIEKTVKWLSSSKRFLEIRGTDVINLD